MNFYLEAPGSMKIVVELQLHLRPILELKARGLGPRARPSSCKVDAAAAAVVAPISATSTMADDEPLSPRMRRLHDALPLLARSARPPAH